jgi:3-oxoadipate enol-lactonase/4-carboxymuconolactone decarboxylase
MPFATRDAVRLYWKLEGAADKPPLVLLNSIGTDMALWDACVPHLLPAFRLLRIDARGHGASDAPPGDYSLAMLADDVAAVMDAAGIEQAAIAGVSLGGMVAMAFVLSRPSRASTLALICTSAAMDRSAWESRIATVRAEGTSAIAGMAVGRFLSPGFAQTHPAIAETLRAGIAAQSDDGYAGAGAAVRDMDLTPRLGAIAMPTLIVTGDKDISTPLEGHGDRLIAGLPDARHVVLASAHLPPIEAPTALASALRHFLLGRPDVAAAADTLHEAGLARRREILGDAWVDRSLANRTPFSADFQAMIARVAWHEIWNRPGLDERTRRLLVIAITAALGRWEEFAMHVRIGLTAGGFTRDELKEVLMQTAIYAGLPVGNTGFAEAGKIIAELDGATA